MDLLLVILTHGGFLHVLQDASNIKDLGVNDSDDLCEGLNMGGVPLNLKNDEIFGCPQGPTGYQIEDGGMECLSMEKNLSVTEFSGTIENALEVIYQILAFSAEPILFLTLLLLVSSFLSIWSTHGRYSRWMRIHKYPYNFVCQGTLLLRHVHIGGKYC